MGVSFSGVIFWFGRMALNTIARKPQHDKLIGQATRLGDQGFAWAFAALNHRAGIAIVEGQAVLRPSPRLQRPERPR
jgi:hypothetical protein